MTELAEPINSIQDTCLDFIHDETKMLLSDSRTEQDENQEIIHSTLGRTKNSPEPQMANNTKMES